MEEIKTMRIRYVEVAKDIYATIVPAWAGSWLSMAWQASCGRKNKESLSVHAEDSLFLIHVNIPQVIAHFKDDALCGVFAPLMINNGKLDQKFVAVGTNAIGHGGAAA